MNQRRLRDDLHRALGEPPAADLRGRVHARIGEDPTPAPPAAALMVAAVIAVLLVAVLIAPHVMARIRAQTAPSDHIAAVTPNPSPPQIAIDASSCRLPVIVLREAGPPGQHVEDPGFVDLKTGTFQSDQSASVEGLPGGGSPGTAAKPAAKPVPAQFLRQVGRWVPVGGAYVAPDERSYVWVELLPQGATYSTFQSSALHLYDLQSSKDRTLWSAPGSIDVRRWDTAGITVLTVPPRGGAGAFWRIDPAKGAAAPLDASADPGRFSPQAADPPASGTIGEDSQGHTLFRIGSRTPGDVEWVFFESSPGQRVTIYRGTQGDATGFDPFGSFGDGTGIWFGDYDQTVVWHWSQSGGLRKSSITGLPAPLSGPNAHEYVRPAGQCG